MGTAASKERMLSVVAGGVGVASVLGFAGLAKIRKSPELPDLRVEQRNANYGELWDGSPAGVILQIDSGIDGDSAENVRHPRYRVVDTSGRRYPLQPFSPDGLDRYWWIPLGYRQPAESPRLEATIGPRVVRTVPLTPFPVPIAQDVKPSPDAPFRLVESEWGATVVPRQPLAKGETWRLRALATRYAADIRRKEFEIYQTTRGYDADFTDRSSDPSERELTLPYPRDAGWVKVSLHTERSEERSEQITIRGLRLGKVNGETTFLVPSVRVISNRLGVRITLPPDAGPARKSAVDHRQARLAVTSDEPVEMTLVRPTPEELGLNFLQVGSAMKAAAHPARGPIKSGPFEAVVQVKCYRQVPLEHRVYVVPVEKSRRATGESP